MLILIADDDAEDREFLSDAIRQIDPSSGIIEARDGDEALSLLKSDILQRPAVIFLDINMPRLNGMDTLKAIRKDHHLNSIPIIMYSTSSNPYEIEACSKLGANRFITKPGDFPKLLDEVKRVFLLIRE